MTRIAHISDIHFGRIKHPSIVQALIDDINGADVDLVVVSGDLTQRAFGHQFRAARRMLDAFDAPTLIVPGNHDVFPWWRLFSRLLDPLRRYRNLIEPDLAPRWRGEGVVVQGINSAHGWTVQSGRVTAPEIEAVIRGFGDAPKGALRVLVVHHVVLQFEDLDQHDVLRGGEELLSAARQAGVHLILSGHLHIPASAPVEGMGPIVVAAGTATSDRGRREFKNNNSYNLIDICESTTEIRERLYDSEIGKFEAVGTASFDRRGRPVLLG